MIVVNCHAFLCLLVEAGCFIFLHPSLSGKVSSLFLEEEETFSCLKKSDIIFPNQAGKLTFIFIIFVFD